MAKMTSIPYIPKKDHRNFDDLDDTRKVMRKKLITMF
jgi:hypothetical protein